MGRLVSIGLGPLVLGTAPLWLAGTAFAQATPAQATAEGAAALQQALTGLYAPLAGPGTGMLKGGWTVEPDGAAYRLTMPAIASSSSQAMPDGTVMTVESHCEATGGTATPVSNSVYRLRLDTPLDCRFTAPAAGIDLHLATRSRVDEFTFDTGHTVFSQFAQHWEGLTGTAADGTQLFAVDRITGTGDGTPGKAPGHQSIDYHVSAEGLHGGDAAGRVQVSAARLHLDATLKDLNISGVFTALGDMVAAQRALAATPGRQPSPADQKKMMAQVGALYAAYGDQVDTGFSVDQLQVKAPGVQVALDRLEVGFGYDGIGGDNGHGRLSLEMGGLAIAPPSPYADWIPGDGRIDLAASNIPYQSLFKLMGKQAFGATPASPDATQAQFKAMGRLLQKAGAGLDIHHFHLVSPKSVFDLTGSVLANGHAAYGATGSGLLRLVGLDALVGFLQQEKATAQLAGGISMLQMMGRETTGDDGHSARNYDLSVDAAGKILVNGNDLESIVPKSK
jgi:hypothetical protein